MVIVGIICCTVAVIFLAFPKQSVVNAIQDLRGFQRPQIWWLAVIEWIVAFSGGLWGLTAILVMGCDELASDKNR